MDYFLLWNSLSVLGAHSLRKLNVNFISKYTQLNNILIS